MAYYRRNYRNYNRYNRGSYNRAKRLEHKEWFPQVVTTAVNPTDSSGAQAALLGNNQLKTDDCTILRTRGVGSVTFSAVATPTILPAFTLGALTVPAKYRSDTANVPNPLSASDTDDWFLWMPFASQPMDPEVVSSVSGAVNFEIDSRAKRKLQADEAVIIVLGIDAHSAWGSDDRINVSLNLRFLVGY